MIQKSIISSRAPKSAFDRAKVSCHMFGMCRDEHEIEHRMMKPRYSWSNGQVERMNRTIKCSSRDPIWRFDCQIRSELVHSMWWFYRATITLRQLMFALFNRLNQSAVADAAEVWSGWNVVPLASSTQMMRAFLFGGHILITPRYQSS